jgi:hypothetical protein
MSATPPDENGTTQRTGFAGHAWQKAVIGKAAASANAAAAYADRLHAPRLHTPVSCDAPPGAVPCFECSMRVSILSVVPTANFIPESDVDSVFPRC